MKKAFLATLLGVAAQCSIASKVQANPQMTCTIIRDTGKEYVGCKRDGSNLVLATPINGVSTYKASEENFHNPKCYDVKSNGITAICGYKR